MTWAQSSAALYVVFATVRVKVSAAVSLGHDLLYHICCLLFKRLEMYFWRDRSDLGRGLRSRSGGSPPKWGYSIEYTVTSCTQE